MLFFSTRKKNVNTDNFRRSFITFRIDTKLSVPSEVGYPYLL